MHQVLLIISAITPFSAIAKFCFFLFTVSVIYQNYGDIMSPCQNLLLISVQYSYQVGFPVSYPYQVLLLLQSLYQQLLEVTSISTPYQLSSSPVIYFHEVIVPSSPITFCYQLFLSLSGIYFPDKVLVSGVPISYSSASTQFPYLKLLLYQLLLLPTVTVSLLHISCSGYSLLIPPSTIFISYSFLLLSATLISHL